MSGGSMSLEFINKAEAALTEKIKACGEVSAKLVEAKQGLSSLQSAPFLKLQAKLSQTQKVANLEVQKLRPLKVKAELAEKNKVAEERELKVLEGFLPEIVEKCNNAE